MRVIVPSFAFVGLHGLVIRALEALTQSGVRTIRHKLRSRCPTSGNAASNISQLPSCARGVDWSRVPESNNAELSSPTSTLEPRSWVARAWA